MDAADPLHTHRDGFHIPRLPNGESVVYLAGNSLGLPPKRAAEMVREELQSWAEHGVEGHFEGPRPWYSYHERLRDSGARLVGASPGEVVIMNSLTVNLHLMMVSFFRPTRERYKILIEDPCFPSDIYAVKSQLRYHGLDPADALIVVKPRAGEHLIRMEDIEAAIDCDGKRIALILLAGVNFVTGQLLDMRRITELGRARGCMVGFDLAHAAGNVPLALHDWGVDFAVWCNYKYLNCGPGAVGGCFVHERHSQQGTISGEAGAARPRFAGWWGNDPSTRFRMHLTDDFVPREGADGWQVSNPPIFSMAPVIASFDIFDGVGMAALREKSIRLTDYLEYLLDRAVAYGSGSGQADRFEIITPRDSTQRGCQLSLRFHHNARGVLEALRERGIICDFREPDVIRAAPVPLYNSFHDVWRFVAALCEATR